MAISHLIIPDAGEPVLRSEGGHKEYRLFLAARDELSALALRLAGSVEVDPAAEVDPAVAWAQDAVPDLMDRLGAALLARDAHVLCDHLSVELLELRRAGISEVHLIGLVDAIAATLPAELEQSRCLLAEGREHLRRTGARSIRSVPESRSLPECGDVSGTTRPGAHLAGPATNGATSASPKTRSAHLAEAPTNGTAVGGSKVAAGVSLAGSQSPGQVFADLLLLGALACQAPVALLSVRQPDGSWSTLSHGLDVRDGCNDAQLFDALAGQREPVEIADLAARLPRSPLSLPPHSLRWAYGVALGAGSGAVSGVVVVLDRYPRQVSKREQRAMGSLARQLGTLLIQLRRSDAPSAHNQPSPSPDLLPRSQRAQAGRSTPGGASTRKQSGLEDLAAMSAAHATANLEDPVTQRHHLLRSQEVAGIFDVTERTVINWAAAGKLPSLRTIGGHLRFRREDVLGLLSPSSVQPDR